MAEERKRKIMVGPVTRHGHKRFCSQKAWGVMTRNHKKKLFLFVIILLDSDKEGNDPIHSTESHFYNDMH